MGNSTKRESDSRRISSSSSSGNFLVTLSSPAGLPILLLSLLSVLSGLGDIGGVILVASILFSSDTFEELYIGRTSLIREMPPRLSSVLAEEQTEDERDAVPNLRCGGGA